MELMAKGKLSETIVDYFITVYYTKKYNTVNANTMAFIQQAL